MEFYFSIDTLLEFFFCQENFYNGLIYYSDENKFTPKGTHLSIYTFYTSQWVQNASL